MDKITKSEVRRYVITSLQAAIPHIFATYFSIII